MNRVKLFITSSLPKGRRSSNQFLVRFTEKGKFQVYPHDSPHAIKNEKTVIYPISTFFTLYVSSTLPSQSLLKKVRQTTSHQLILVLSSPIPSTDFQSFCKYADIIPLIICLDSKKTTPSYCLYCFPPKQSFKTSLRYIYPGIEYVEIPNHENTQPKYQRMIYTLEEDFVYVSRYRKRFQRVNRNMGVVALYKLAKYIAAKVMRKLDIAHFDELKDFILSSEKMRAKGISGKGNDVLRKEIEDLFVKVVESFKLRKHEVLELEWEPFSEEEMRKMGSNYLSYYVSSSSSIVSHISPRVVDDEIEYPSPRKSFERNKSSSGRSYYYNEDMDAIFSRTKEEEEYDQNRNQSKHYISSREKYSFGSDDFLRRRTKGNGLEDSDSEGSRSYKTSAVEVEKHFKNLIRTIEKNCETNIRNQMSTEIERLKKLYYLKEQKMRLEYEERLGENERVIRRLKNHVSVLKDRLRKCEGSKDLYHIDHTL